MSEIFPVDEIYSEPEERHSPALWQQIGRIEVCLTAIASCGCYFSSYRSKRKMPMQVQFHAPQIAAALPPPIDVSVHDLQSQESPQQPRFKDLPCPDGSNDSPNHKGMIETVVRELASKGYLWPRTALRLEFTIKPAILYIHPFKFLWVAFSNPELKKLMVENVQHDRLAKKGYIAGVNTGMKREVENKNIEPYLADFAEEVGTDAEKLRPLIEQGAKAQDWTLLVEHLIKC